MPQRGLIMERGLVITEPSEVPSPSPMRRSLLVGFRVITFAMFYLKKCGAWEHLTLMLD